MAALCAGKKLQEEATCPICLDFFTDPVTLSCGHNFCQGCITQCWGEPPTNAPCPECRKRVEPRDLRPNRQLANVVAIAKEFSEQVEQQAGDWRVCKRHLEPLKLFCKDDEAPICVVCDRAKEHRAHTVVPAEEAAQEYQDLFWGFLERSRKRREKILACKANAEKESQNLLNQIVAERQKAMVEFRQLHQLLEEQEKLLLTQMEEVEKEIVGRRDKHMKKLSMELSSLNNVIQEMEEKCEQSASDLLQDVRSTLQRCKEKERSEYPVPFLPTMKQKIWEFNKRNTFLENAMKQFKAANVTLDPDTTHPQLILAEDYKSITLDPGTARLANVTLDPDTAHPLLILSEDCKSVRHGAKHQNVPNTSERFSIFCFVLGCEGFTAGRHCWEVNVGKGGNWAVGAAKKSVKRKDMFKWGPKAGIWAVRKWGDQYLALNCPNIPLYLSGGPKRIRVTLNYAEGQVAFSDADLEAPIYTFSEDSFSGETLQPFFCVDEEATLTLAP